ncbi:MAG: DNRLRE domain-containing protein [Phycisphaerae bacterium]|nr:DNRLRE domain-containing protein [Phycisphaerae bacterium]
MPIFRSLGVVLVGVMAAPLMADSVQLQAVADGTLYESPGGEIANGSGQHVFAGLNALDEIRRACVRFDVSSIPAGSTVHSAVLTLNLSRAISGDLPVYVHRITASWGEGASVAPGREGGGTVAEADDATWIHRFYDTSFWATPGGDFVFTASATQMVGFDAGPINWSDAGLVADVQGWVNGSFANHGWMLRGAEDVEASAKRFDSRQNIEPSVRPVLSVSFTPPPPPCTGDYDGDRDVDFADITFVLAGFNNPFTFGDITVVLANFGSSCGGIH